MLDSIERSPIPFATIYLDSLYMTTSDFDGNFSIEVCSNESLTLNIAQSNYISKTISLKGIQYPHEILLSKIPPNDSFVLEGVPIDTAYYHSGSIKIIRYPKNDKIEFYKNGNYKYQIVNENSRYWYKNGKIKQIDILETNHERTIIKYYKNGKLKSHESLYWKFNKNKNEGEWSK
ncbi:MAG: hypothetical protein HND54_13325 [Bacteroidetes bacterium]|nr:hypothetical protein [Bacteroidota bacterium]